MEEQHLKGISIFRPRNKNILGYLKVLPSYSFAGSVRRSIGLAPICEDHFARRNVPRCSTTHRKKRYVCPILCDLDVSLDNSRLQHTRNSRSACYFDSPDFDLCCFPQPIKRTAHLLWARHLGSAQLLLLDPFAPQEWSSSNFSCSLSRNITSHSMENVAFPSLLRWKMIILPILTTLLIHLS